MDFLAPGDDNIVVEETAAALGLPNTAFIIKLYDKYFDGIMSQLNQLQEALKIKDYETGKSIAHSIKGSSRNIRLNAIGNLAEEIEFFCKEPSDTDMLPKVQQLKEMHERVFKNYLVKYKN